MILKSKGIQKPTEEQIAEMEVWAEWSNGSIWYTIAYNYDGHHILYATEESDGSEPARLVFLLSNRENNNATSIEYYYYFEEFESSVTGTTVPKDTWIYYSTNWQFPEYNMFLEHPGNLYYNEKTDKAVIYSESYFSTLGREIKENELFLSTQKTMALKTKGKYCDDDIKILPLLQKKTTVSNGVITPDEGFCGLDAVLVEVDKGIYPEGTKTLTTNGTWDVGEYEEAYVDLLPRELNLCNIDIKFNGQYYPPEDKDGFYSITVNVQPGVTPKLQPEKYIDTNGHHCPDEGYDGFEKVTVNVQPPLKEEEITENGTHQVGSSYEGYKKVVVNVPEPPAGTGEHVVRFVDYDGRIIKQQYLNRGDVFTMPIPFTFISDRINQRSFVSSTGTAKIRSSTGAEVHELRCEVENSDVTIANIYYPVSGYSEFDITLNEITGKTIELSDDASVWNTRKIDWGDSKATTAGKWNRITYPDYGNYTIKIEGLKKVPSYFFKQDEDTPNTFCKRVFLAESVTAIDENAFRNCICLESTTLPHRITTIGPYAFYGCRSLTNIAIPSSVETIEEYTFGNCYSLFSAVFSEDTTKKSSSFSNCHALNKY